MLTTSDSDNGRMLVETADDGETLYLSRAGHRYEVHVTTQGVLEVRGLREHGWGLAVVPQGSNWLEIVSTDRRVSRLTR